MDRFARETTSLWWTYVLGPILSLLPARWRENKFSAQQISWTRATTISGALQFFVFGPIILLATLGLLQHAAFQNMLVLFRGNSVEAIRGDQSNLFTLWLAALNPLSWLAAYLMFEGAGRAFAAVITGEAPGTLAFVLVEAIHRRVHSRRAANNPIPDVITEIHDGRGAERAFVSDRDAGDSGWHLKIEAAKAKQLWTIGRLVHFRGSFYRIEAYQQTRGPRPATYFLKRLPAGVLNAQVIQYSGPTR